MGREKSIEKRGELDSMTSESQWWRISWLAVSRSYGCFLKHFSRKSLHY